MKLKDFGQYLQKKSLSRLLHQARKDSLDRLPAHRDLARSHRKRVAPKRTGTA